MTASDAELLRLRNKVHALEKQVWGLAGVIKELGRGIGELRDQVHELEERVDGMTEADKIAAAVTAGIHADRHRRFTLPRRLAATAAATILLVPALHDLVHWLSGG